VAVVQTPRTPVRDVTNPQPRNRAAAANFNISFPTL
jgi:hypothetical protein